MTLEMENPASGTETGLSRVFMLGGEEHTQPNANRPGNQWLPLELEAVRRTRSALLCRGAERLNALAIAAAYANAARAAALLGGAR